MLLHNVNGCGTFSRMPLFLRRHSFPCPNRAVMRRGNRVERPKQNNFPLKDETISQDIYLHIMVRRSFLRLDPIIYVNIRSPLRGKWAFIRKMI